MAHILKCISCKSYGLSVECSCGSKREIVIPAKYSPDDKYAKYRRMAKEEKGEFSGNPKSKYSKNSNDGLDEDFNDDFDDDLQEEGDEDK